MELRHLRYFIALAKELSFTKAAQKLYISQPSLSQQIKQLEEEVGVPLLRRNGQSLQLTEEGQVFFEEAQKTLQQAKKAIHAARQVANTKLEIVAVGFVPVAELLVFPEILPLLKKQRPQLKIEYHSLGDKGQLSSLRRGELDVAFTRNPVYDESVTSYLLFEEPLKLAIPANHPYAALDVVPLKKLDGCDFVVSDPDVAFELNRIVMQFAAKNRITMANIHYSRNILFNINAVGMGLGLSFLPAYTENLLGKNVVIRPTDKPLPRIGLYLNHKIGELAPPVALFADLVRGYFQAAQGNGRPQP